MFIYQETILVLQKVWRNIENHTLMNPVKFRSIGVTLMIHLNSQLPIHMVKKLINLITLTKSWKPKISPVLLINSTILKKINTPHMLENHSVKDIQDNMTGQHRHKVVQLNLVFHQLVLKVQKIWFTQWVEPSLMRIELFKKCIRKLTETFSQESRKTEIMNGNSTQMLMFSDMVKRELKMELLWLYMPNAMKMFSQKPQSSKRLLRIIKP